MASERENLQAGVFVVVGLVLALVIIFALVDIRSWFEGTQIIRIYYQLTDGIKGLKVGAPVTLGDEPVGTVTLIDDVIRRLDHQGNASEVGEDTVVGKLVTMEIPDHIRLFWNAQIELQVPTLGSGTRLNIRSTGSGQRYRENEALPQPVAGQLLLPPDILANLPTGALPGAVGRNELIRSAIAEAGIGDLQRQQVRQIIDNIAALTSDLREKLPGVVDTVQTLLNDAKPIVSDAQQTMTQAKAAVTEAHDIVTAVKSRSGPWLDRIDSVTSNADASMQTVRDLLKDKDPDLRLAVENVRDITQSVRDQTLMAIDQAIAKASDALDNMRETTGQLKDVVITQRPVLQRALANFQLTSDQLKLAAIEVRRSPWRLLYRPTDQELEHDNLYDAARSFALAAGALDAATASLREIIQQPDLPAERVQPMLDHLEQLYAEYEKAEAAFWQALKNTPPAP